MQNKIEFRLSEIIKIYKKFYKINKKILKVKF